DPQVIDFGATGLGTTAHATLALRNEGDVAAQLTSLRTRGSNDVAIAVAPALPAEIAPGSTLELGVDYAPAGAGDLAAEMLLGFADASAELRVPLSGRGEGPLFLVQPSTLDFGSSSGRGQRSVLLVNAGSAPVEVRSIELRGDPVFAMRNRPPLPVTLAR